MPERRMPALSLAALPGRRRAILDLAAEAEERGFSGLFGPSLGDSLSLCLAMAMRTRNIALGTTIYPLYQRHVVDFAQTAAFLHEVSGGRFYFGVGVSHGPVHDRLGIKVGKPLADVRRFVEQLRQVPRVGELPPLVLAAMRDRMVSLASEIADGLVFANGARSYMSHSLGLVDQRPDFFVADMVPTCISDDRAAAALVHRRTLSRYVALPNYRNYWKAAGYVEEMQAVEKALEVGDEARVQQCMTDKWLSDVTLFGSVSEVREGVEAWFDAGIPTPILVPSSATGNQLQAIQEVFDAFA